MNNNIYDGFTIERDSETTAYRIAQFKRLNISPLTIATIKIVSGNGGETNYININDNELKAIIEILTK